MEIRLFEANNGSCPYLDNQNWMSFMFQADSLDNAVYESLIEKGFRRNGLMFYKNNCPDCDQCKPIRVLVNQFKCSKSQNKILKKNNEVLIKSSPIAFDEESFLLYQNFSEGRFKSSTSKEDFENFLGQSSVETIMMKYYDQEKLIGVGWVDILPNSLSSVYFAYDLGYAKRSLGVFSILKEIELCRELKKENLQLGFWVDGAKTMLYKTQYKPNELLINGVWERSEL